MAPTGTERRGNHTRIYRNLNKVEYCDEKDLLNFHSLSIGSKYSKYFSQAIVMIKILKISTIIKKTTA